VIRATTLALFGLLVATPLTAQVTTATFYGIVVDGRCAGVSITLCHEQTGTVMTETTDTDGEFVFSFVAVGCTRSASS